MFKRAMILLLTIIIIYNTVGCSSTTKANTKSKDNWKIGIVTGTVIQNEEEYRAAEQVLAKYGEEHVIVLTYPDKYMDEQETVISNILGLAANPDVKAIIAVKAIEGTLAAFEKARELRGDDILLISGIVAEDTKRASLVNDFCLKIDESSIEEKKEASFLSELNIPEDKKDDAEWIRNEIRKKLEENGLTGRLPVWQSPMGMTFIKSGADYAAKWIDGEITDKCDIKELEKCFLDDTGLEIKLTPIEEDGVIYDNYFICSYCKTH